MPKPNRRKTGKLKTRKKKGQADRGSEESPWGDPGEAAKTRNQGNGQTSRCSTKGINRVFEV